MAVEERPEWLNDKELLWRADQLFFSHKDMASIETSLNLEQYNNIQEFYSDVLTIQHNVAIFHGYESQEYAASELMVRDCIHDLSELQICVDCYRHSNEKLNPKWFCLPCRVPHRLVWAKQKGYPYWPAKVIRESNTQIDVRFFGGKYERSLLGRAFVKDIETPKEKLQIKSSSAFNKSVEELKFHQKLLNNPSDLTKLIETSSKQKVKPISKPRLGSIKHSTKSTTNNNTKTAATTNNNTANLSVNSSQNNDNNSNIDVNDIYRFDETPLPPIARSSTPLNIQRQKRKNSSHEGITSTSKKRSVSSEIECEEVDAGVVEPIETCQDNFAIGNLDYNGTYEQVSSSTENCKSQEMAVRNQDNGMQQLEHPFSDSVEKMRRKLETLDDKKDIIRCAMEHMQGEIDKMNKEHNKYIKGLFEKQITQLSETKKKQWCYNCEKDAIYHCCWNTAYCSQSCQQQHWQAEHKKVCRRKH